MLLLSAPNISGNEWTYVKDCLDTAWVSSVGAYVDRFERMVADFAGAKYGIASMNGTAALHLSLQLSGVQRSDYVIAPNITFIASINAIKYTGADPILVDIDPRTWQMDLDVLERFLQEETEQRGGFCHLKSNGRRIPAIMPVHVLGNMCDMERLSAICLQFNLEMVEDATEALGSWYKGKHAGTFGRLGCFSFNGNKIITTGGGGVIVTDDEQLAKRAKHLTTQAKSDPMEYMHDEVGYNYRLVNVLAAIGVAQMEQLPGFIQRKKQINAYYRSRLQDIPGVFFQEVLPGADTNCWLFTFGVPQMRTLLQQLNEKKMQSRPFWVPMNQLPMFQNDLYISNNDQSGMIYSQCISIPCSTDITDAQLEQVADAVVAVLSQSVAVV